MSLMGALLLLLPKGVPFRLLGWPMLLLAVFPPREPVPHGRVEVVQLDVGQGQALVLRTRHHTLLYDAGPRSGASTWARAWCCLRCKSWASGRWI